MDSGVYYTTLGEKLQVPLRKNASAFALCPPGSPPVSGRQVKPAPQKRHALAPRKREKMSPAAQKYMIHSRIFIFLFTGTW